MNEEANDDDLASAALMPVGRPVLTAEAFDLGFTPRRLARLVGLQLVRRPIKGVYLSSATHDDTQLRLEVLRLVVPEGCVVTDRTAGWVWVGDRILPPNAHLVTPPLSVFCKPGHRLRSKLTDSGERRFLARDLLEVDKLTITTALRTACDLGRLLHRDQALAALDALASVDAFAAEELILEAQRFRRYRGVIQLRVLVTIVDGRAESQGESILRLRWYDAGLPRPECQIEVESPWGTSYRLDIGLEELLLAAEYDGELFHGAYEVGGDTRRRDWMSGEFGWRIVVARKENLFGQNANIHTLLTSAWSEVSRRPSPLTRP